MNGHYMFYEIDDEIVDSVENNLYFKIHFVLFENGALTRRMVDMFTENDFYSK